MNVVGKTFRLLNDQIAVTPWAPNGGQRSHIKPLAIQELAKALVVSLDSDMLAICADDLPSNIADEMTTPALVRRSV